jgi:hypothetical protein
LDDRAIAIENIAVKEKMSSTLVITANVSILKDENQGTILSTIGAMNANQTGITSTFDIVNADVAEHLSLGITAQDIQTASDCSVDFSRAKTLPWKTDGNGNPVSWPPGNEIMAKFGYGNVNDEDWWKNNGLNPPSQWNVSGALDILPAVSVSNHQKQLARDVLDDAVHGVTNIWSDKTMNDIGSLMHSSNFWSHRGADA